MKRTINTLSILVGAAIVVGAIGAAPARAADVIRLEEISIEGKLQKPQATYILQRAQNLNLGESLQLEEEKLAPKILDDAKKKLFDVPED